MVLPDGYDGFTAAKKQEVLWKQCEATKYISKEEIDANNTDASGFESLQIFVNFYTHATLKEETDELFRGRKKVIHRRGCAATFELRVPAGNKAPFTGIFGASSVGVVRFSLGRMAHPPYAPAAALKFLIDGQKVCLDNGDGQDKDVNYFRHPFSNIFPPVKGDVQKAIDVAFNLSVQTLPGGPRDRPEEARNQPLWAAAKITPDGKEVDTVVEPYQVFFTPPKKLTEAYDSVINTKGTEDQDFRITLHDICKKGAVLWEVTGKRTNEETEQPVPIGQVVLTSEVLACSYCDEVLFFQHMRFRRPE